MPEIREEVIMFLVAVVSGMVIRFVYQCIECIRTLHKHKLLYVEIEDFLYWIGTALYLFVQIYHTSYGVVRWDFVLGVVIGAVFSTFLIRKMKKMLKKISDFHSGKSIAKKQKKRYYK